MRSFSQKTVRPPRVSRQPAFGQYALPLPEIENKELVATRIEGPQWRLGEGGRQVVVEDGILPDGMDTDFFQRLLCEMDAVATTDDLGVG